VLSDGDTTDTLNIQGTFSSGNFTIASDGSTGTDITEGVAGLGHTLSSTITTAITLTSPANNPFTITSIGEAAPTAASATAIYAFGGAATNWTITNAGIVAGGPSAGSNGIDLGRGGAHVTSGTIINQGGGTITGSNGVSIYNDVASSIVNQAGATIAAFGAYGVVLRTTSGGTVTNAGVISAPTAHFAVLFAQNSPSNRVIDDPGAVFIGKISGGGGVLELASAAGAGTISGLGGTVTNFTSLVFDTGAQWTVGGNDLAGGLGTLGIGGFTVGDTIDLTGFAAVTETFASNMLMLSDGDTTETLNIQGAFSSSNFTIASDGSTGTDITFAAGVAALVYGATIDETGIVAASETVAAGVMTLFNGGAAAVGTIVVGTSLSTGDFILAPANGDTGTDVILNTVFGSYTSGVTVLVNPTTIATAAQVFNVSSSGNAAAAVYGPAAQYWTLTNQGTVSATGSRGDGINLRAGGLVINGISGTISGDYGVHSNQSATVENNGSINGNTGAAIYLYGGTVVNSGVLADAGAGDGVFIYQGASVTNLSGGMITAATRPGIYVYQTGSVTNAGTIRGGSEGVLGPHALTVANTGVILATGTAGRGVVLETGGFVTNSSSGTISAGIYGIFIGGAAGTVDNAGTIQASAGGGVYLYTGTIQNSGLIVGSNRNGVYINGDGSVTNQPGGTITGATGVKFTGVGNVANYGSMQGASTGVDGVGLNVTNTGVILGTGTSSDAIDLASGYVTNSASGTISGGNIGVRATNGPVAIDNSGTIQGTAGRGIFLAGGTVVNSGLIAGGSAASAAYSSGAASITNLSTGTMAAGTGVDFAGESKNTLTNSGTIIGSAGTAVSFAAGGTDRLVDNPGAVFTGDINGGNTATSVLELASAASAGTISGFNGTTVTNFATLQFDAGAQWTVAGNDLANGLGTLDIDGFTSGDTIDLTGFVATSETFASNVLVLSDGDSTDTLNIQGAFSSSNFTIASDGSTGTDITFGTDVEALVYAATIDETGIVAVSETVTAGVMTLLDAAFAAVGTIVVGPSLSSGDFMLRPDAGSGTDVIVNTVFGTYSSGVTLLTNPTTIAGTANITGTVLGGIGVIGRPGRCGR
jgi:hypothetical protein